MVYQEALDYIHNINWCFCNPGLARIGELCEKLGHPERDLRFIHVAGTNGKGSFCAMTASILQQAGYKVGLFTSPFIRTFNERMQINGQNIPNETLASLTEKVRPVADGMTDKPTEFELITAIAFLYFKQEQCDVVVLETGLGGRLDSTNIIKAPLLSVITGIAKDHTAILGDTICAIAGEKAGIIKEGIPVLFGGEDQEAATVIRQVADQQHAPFYQTDHTALSLQQAGLDGSIFDFKEWRRLHLPLLGLYQLKNVANVLSAVEILREAGLNLPDKAVTDGLKCARWHGRFEKVSDTPLILFDGAHNPQGIRISVDSIKTYFPHQKVLVLTGVLQDKDYTDISAMLAEITDTAFTVTPHSPRALSAKDYARVLQNAGVNATPFDTIKTGFAAAKETASVQGKPLVCIGSLYLYADLYPLF